MMMKSSILHETEQVIVLENGTCPGRQARMGWRIVIPSALGPNTRPAALEQNAQRRFESRAIAAHKSAAEGGRKEGQNWLARAAEFNCSERAGGGEKEMLHAADCARGWGNGSRPSLCDGIIECSRSANSNALSQASSASKSACICTAWTAATEKGISSPSAR